MSETANVRVVISAVTEAAQKAIDDVGDELTGLAGEAAVGQAALDEVSDELNEASTAGAFLSRVLDDVGDEAMDAAVKNEVLQATLDEVSDELNEASAAAARTSGLFTALSLSTDGAAVSMGFMGTVMTLSLIPSIMTLVTVLAPLVALLGVLTGGAFALAGAFGAVIGSGFLAWGKELADQNSEQLAQTERRIKQLESLQEQTGSLSAAQQKQLRVLKEQKDELDDQTTITGALAGQFADLREELVPIIADLGDDFIPLIRDGVRAIPELIQRMVNAVGGTDDFASALRDFGAAAMEFLPAFTGFMFQLARDALPVAREFFGWLRKNGPGIWDSMTEAVDELEPEFRDLLDALIDMGPELMEFGTNVGEVVLPALTDLINAATDFMAAVNDMDEGLQRLVISGLILAPVLIWLGGKVAWLIGLFVGKGALAGAVAKVAGMLTGGGAAGTAGLFGAAIAVGGALGLIGIKALDAVGALDELEKAGKRVRDELGGDAVDAALTAGNVSSFGGLEAFSKLGVTAVDIARLEDDWGADERAQIDDTFSSAQSNTADNAQTVINGGLNVEVDGGNSFGNNPYRDSRRLGDQLNREVRQDFGASR